APHTSGSQKSDNGAPAGMPLYLQGARRTAASNYGAVQASLAYEEQKLQTISAAPAASAPEPTAAVFSGVDIRENTAVKRANKPVLERTFPAVPAISGEGEEAHSVAYSLTLRGRTDATFNNTFSTLHTQTTPGTGCQECSGGDCAHVRGTLESTFTVATQVTLPSVADYPDLTPCQKQRVQDAITNVLAPHEQRHVAAFRTYNGTTRT